MNEYWRWLARRHGWWWFVRHPRYWWSPSERMTFAGSGAMDAFARGYAQAEREYRRLHGGTDDRPE